MAHPYYKKKGGKKRRSYIWLILFVILILVLSVPWLMPAGMTTSEPFKTLKSITTFPMEYEWQYSFKSKPEETPKGNIDVNSLSTSPMTLSESYFPLTVGNKWVYEHIVKGNMMNPDSKKITIKTVEIVEEKAVGDFNLYKIKTTEGSGVDFSYYFVNENGLNVTNDDRRPTRHCVRVLKRNPQVGDTWREFGETGAQSTANTIENFTVPAGTFTCLLVETRYAKTRDRIYKTWYAENVGIISQQHGTDPARGIEEWHLKEYTLK